MNVILLNSDHRHVSTTHVAISRVVSSRTPTGGSDVKGSVFEVKWGKESELRKSTKKKKRKKEKKKKKHIRG